MLFPRHMFFIFGENKKDMIKLFKDKFNLRITIRTNLKIVDFLDVTFNLTNGTYQPYSKPNSYVNFLSSHTPNIISRIPDMISDRINRISSDKHIFDRAATFYNDALSVSGQKDKITFNKIPPKTSRSRFQNIVWFNPGVTN